MAEYDAAPPPPGCPLRLPASRPAGGPRGGGGGWDPPGGPNLVPGPVGAALAAPAEVLTGAELVRLSILYRSGWPVQGWVLGNFGPGQPGGRVQVQILAYQWGSLRLRTVTPARAPGGLPSSAAAWRRLPRCSVDHDAPSQGPGGACQC